MVSGGGTTAAVDANSTVVCTSNLPNPDLNGVVAAGSNVIVDIQAGATVFGGNPSDTAVRVLSGSEVFNSGTINPGNDWAYGIYGAGDGNSIQNSGEVLSGFTGASGILVAGQGNSIVNASSGVIDLQGEQSIGVALSGADNTFVNNGLINVSGDSGAGVMVGPLDPLAGGNVVTNTGTIHVSGFLGSGVVLAMPVNGQTSQLNNMAGGVISSDFGNAVLAGNGDDVVQNFGTISSGVGLAIRLNGGDNTLVLGTTSSISGIVDGGSGSNNRLVLTGSGLGTFDMSVVGTANQYRGFSIFEKNGGSTWTLTGTSEAVDWQLNGGTLVVDSSSLAGNVTSSTGSIVFDQTADGTYAGSISGGARLIKEGAGILTLTGTNTFVGAQVNSGVLAGDTDSIQSGVNIGSVGELQFAQAGAGTYAGALGGDGTVRFAGGDITLTGYNENFSGTTILQSGVVSIGAAENVGAGQIVVDGGTLASLASDVVLDNEFLVNGVAGLDASLGTLSLTGDITGAGSLSIAAGMVQLSGLNSYGGGTVVASGAELVGDSDSIIGDIANSGTVRFDQGFDGVYGGEVSGLGSLVKSGTGTLQLSAVNLHTGGTFIEDGTLVANFANSISGQVVNDAELVFDQIGPGTFTGDISGTGHVTKQGTGTLTLLGMNSYSGGTTIAQGTLVGDSHSLQGDIVNSAALVFDQLDIGTYAGDISGAGSVEIKGSRTLTFAGANTYTGATVISGGLLTLAGGQAILDTGSINQTGGRLQIQDDEVIGRLNGQGSLVLEASLTLGGANNDTYNATITGGGALVKTGTGTFTLSGIALQAGGTFIESGSFVSVDGALQSRVDIADGAALEFAQSVDGNFAGFLTGSGAVTKSGVGILSLEGDNSGFTGDVTITEGALSVGTNYNLGTGDLRFQGGTALIIVGNTTIANTIDLFDNNGSGVSFVANADATLTGDVIGEGFFVKAGPGNLTLTGANSYTGGTIVGDGKLIGTTGSLQGSFFVDNAGTLEFAQSTVGTFAGNISGDGVVSYAGGGTIVLTGNNSGHIGETWIANTTVSIGSADALGTGIVALKGTLHTTDDMTLAHDFVLGGSGIFRIDGTTVLAGTLSDEGGIPSRMRKEGVGNLILTQSNTYSSGTTLIDGTITIAADGALGSGDLNIQGGSLVFDQSTTLANQIFLAGAGDLRTNGNDVTLAGGITRGGSLSVSGGGTVTLTASNGYTGGTVIGAGTTLAGHTNSLVGNMVNNGTVEFNQAFNGQFTGQISGSGSVEILGPGTVQLMAPNSYTGGTLVQNGTLMGHSSAIQGDIINNATVAFNQTVDGTYSGDMSGSGQMVVQGAATLVLTGQNSHTGGTTISGGTLVTSTENLSGTIAVAGQLVFNQTTDGTYADQISGSGTLTKLGGGNLTLTGTNSYTGSTFVNAGTLTGDSDSLGGFIVNNASLVFDQASDGSLLGSITGNGSLIKRGAGNLTFTGTHLFAGLTTIEEGTLTGNSSNIKGLITNNAALVFDQQVDGNFIGGIGGSGSVLKTGAGVLVMVGGNDYTGGTVVSSGALLGNALSLQGDIVNNATVGFNQVANGVYSGAMTGSGMLVKIGTGALTLAGTTEHTGGTLVSEGMLIAHTESLGGDVVNNAALAFDQFFDGEFAGIVSGSGSLIKLGEGNLTLSGLNTYTGGTSVEDGILTATTDTLGGGIVNNATVAFAQDFDGTYAGDMSGAGVLVKLGTGALTLTGYSDMAGGNRIEEGSLITTSANLAGAVVNQATLVFAQPTDGAFAGAISGTGELIKRGSGNLTLTGTNSYGGGTIVENGTLTGSAASLQGDIVNNAAVAFDQTGVGTYAGDLSGTGTLTKSGAGTLILAGSNSHSGGTLITAGALVTSTANLGGNVDNQAVLAFDQGFDGDFAGVVTGTGALIKFGDGNLTLAGLNSYTGGTLVDEGTLTGTTDSLQGVIINNATVAFDQDFDGTYASAMSGDGALVKEGLGILTLTGANSFAGGTHIVGGAIEANTNTLLGAVINDARLIFTQTFDGTFTGPIDGQGTLLKQGSGNLILTAANSYTGGTFVEDGTLTGNALSLQGDIVNNSAVTFDQAGVGTYAGDMSGTGLLTKTGGGSLILLGSNSHSGGTLIAAGTLVATSASLTGAVDNWAVLTFDQDFDGTFAGAVTGVGSLIKLGTGNLTLSGFKTYAGGTFVEEGVLTGTTDSLQGAIVNDATVAFDQAADGTYAGDMSGSGVLAKLGTGALTLTGYSDMAGGTQIAEGTLITTSANLAGAVVNDATLIFDQTANGAFGGAISGTGEFVKQGSGNLTLTGTNSHTGGTLVEDGTLTGNAASLQGDIVNDAAVVFAQSGVGTYAGDLSGTGTLTKTGTGTLILSGSNTHTGGTLIAAGTLATGTANLGGQIDNRAVLLLDQDNNGTFTGTVFGTGQLVKQGTGNVTLSGSSSYTGGTLVDEGTLTGTTDSLQGAIVNNATVAFDQAVAGTYAGDMSGTGVFVKLGTGALTLTGHSDMAGGTRIDAGSLITTSANLAGDIVDNASLIFDQTADGAFAGAISGTGELVKLGGGQLILSGANSYGGGTTVTGGVLIGNSASLQGAIENDAIVAFDQSANGIFDGSMSGSGLLVKLGAGALELGGLVAHSGGTLIDEGTLIASSATLTGAVDNRATLTFDQDFDGRFGGAISGIGALSKWGTGNLTLSGVSSHSGGTLIGQGALTINSASLAGDIVNNATLVFDQALDGSFGGIISGTGELIKTGAGALTLAGANSYAGGTAVLDGALIGNSVSLQGAIDNHAIVEFAQALDGIHAGVLSGSGALIKSGAGILLLSGANSYTGGTSIVGGVLQGDAASLQGDIAVADNAGLAFAQAATGTYGGSLSGAGTVAQIGSGTLILSGDNTAFDGTFQLVAGTVSVDDVAQLGTAVVEFDGGTLRLAGEFDLQNGLLVNGSGALDLAADASFTGAFAGSGTFDKVGTSALNFLGDGSGFNGSFNVLGGQLWANGLLNNAIVFVESGARIGGSGTIGGLIVRSGGTVAPGNSIDTLSVAGDILFETGSTFSIEIDALTTGSDLLAATGTAQLHGLVDVTTLGGRVRFGSTYRILTAEQGVFGTFDDLQFQGQMVAELPFLRLELEYSPNAVDLVLGIDRVALAGVDGTHNQMATAVAAADLPDESTILQELALLNTDEALAALDLLSGEVHASVPSQLFEDSRLVREATLGRLRQDIRSGSWGQVFGSWGSVDSDGNYGRVERSTKGFAGGADLAFGGAFRVGAVLGYTDSSETLPTRGSKAEISAFHFGGYAGAQLGDFEVLAGSIYANSKIDTQRNVVVGEFADSLTADYKATSLQGFIEVSYGFDLGSIRVQPTANYTIVDLSTKGAVEDGGEAALSRASSSETVQLGTLGLRGVSEHGKLTGSGFVGWRHAFGDVAPGAMLSFEGGAPFSILGAEIADDAGVVELDARWDLGGGVSVGASYSGVLGSQVQDHAGKVSLTFSF